MGNAQRDAKLVVQLRAETKQLTKDLNTAKGRLQRFNSSVNKIGQQIRSTMLAAFGGAAILQGLRTAITSLTGFELVMDKVRAISGASSKEMEALTKNALFLGKTTKFTAGEIGNLQLQLSKIGFVSSEILNTTDAVRKLALVADEDLGEAAKSMAGTLNGFNLNARESGRVANVMAESFSKTALTLEKFTVGTANSSAIANALGVTIEENTARLGKLVSANIDASKAGTDLRKIYIELNRAGVSYTEALDMVEGATNKVGTATDLVGIRSSGALVILAAQREEVDKLTTSLGDNVTELDSMATVIEDNLINDWKKFTSALDGAIQKAGIFNGILRSTVQTLIGFVNGIFGGAAVYEKFAKAGIKVSKVTGITIDDVVKLAEHEENLKRQVKEATETLVKGTDGMTDLSDSSVSAAEALGEINKRVEAYSQSPFIDEIKASVVAFIEQKEAAEKTAIALGKVNAEQERAAAIAARASAAQFRTTGAFVPTKGELGDDIVFDTGDSEFDDALAEASRVAEEWKKVYAQVQADAANFTSMLRNVATDALVSAFDSLGDAIGGGGTTLADAFGKIITIMASHMQRIGAAMIAHGIAQVLFKKSLETLNGFAAIAAGGALVAAGGILKAAQGGFASSMGGGGGSASGGGSFSGQRGGQSINVNVEGTLVADGRSLVAVFNQQNRSDIRNIG